MLSVPLFVYSTPLRSDRHSDAPKSPCHLSDLSYRPRSDGQASSLTAVAFWLPAPSYLPSTHSRLALDHHNGCHSFSSEVARVRLPPFHICYQSRLHRRSAHHGESGYIKTVKDRA
jgi:hypothetical protein